MSLILSGQFGFVVSQFGHRIAKRVFSNGITTAGIHDLEDLYFSNGTTAAAWYLG